MFISNITILLHFSKGIDSQLLFFYNEGTKNKHECQKISFNVV